MECKNNINRFTKLESQTKTDFWRNGADAFFEQAFLPLDWPEQCEMLAYFHYRLRQEYERWLDESIERKEHALTSIENAENALKRLLQ